MSTQGGSLPRPQTDPAGRWVAMLLRPLVHRRLGGVATHGLALAGCRVTALVVSVAISFAILFPVVAVAQDVVKVQDEVVKAQDLQDAKDQVPPPPLNGGGVELNVQLGAVGTLSADTGTGVMPLATVAVDGPIPAFGRLLGRAYTRLGIGGAPGETVNLSSVDTFRSGRADIGVYYVAGQLKVGEEDILTGIVLEAGFSTRMRRDDAQPLERLARHVGIGVIVRERSAGSSITVLWGRDELASDELGWGQVTVRGQVPVAVLGDSLIILGDAVLSLGPGRTVIDGRTPVNQRDVLRLGVAVDVGAAIRAVRGGP